MIYNTFERSILILWTIIATAALSFPTVVSSPPEKADQVCDASAKDIPGGSNSGSCQHSLCHHDMNRCAVPSSIYESSSRSGKTAMAYVPNSVLTPPTTTTSGVSNDTVIVCDATSAATSPYRVATWPFFRSTLRKAPTITIKINFWTCQSQSQPSASSSDNKVEAKSNSYWSYFVSSKKAKQSTTSTGTAISDSQCCCQPYHHIHKEDVMDIEIWQARPDGTYPSIRSAWKDGNQECRARYKLSPPTTPHHHHHQSENTTATKTTTSSLVVHTLAPGSTGIWNGLGPNRWDVPPYGPPVLHMMIHASPNATTTATKTSFVDIPIVISPTTLDAATFYGSDYRGPAWVRPASTPHRRPPAQLLYHVTKWEPKPQQHHIDMEMDVFLPREPISTTVSSLHKVLCPSSSYWYGFPTWFVVEPVAVCAPWLLDFFPF